MATQVQTSHLEPALQGLLARLRRRIRGYVWLDGVATALAWLGTAFWLSLALDWSIEPPWQFRVVVLALTAIVWGYLIYRGILRRAFVPLSDTSLAVVVERRYRNFRDSLVTSVELVERTTSDHAFSREMLDHTHREAVREASAVRLGEIFRWQPLLLSALAAVALAGSIAAYALLNPDSFGTWTQRVLLLSNDLWPRRTHLSIDGFDQVVKVVKSSDLKLQVRVTGEIPANVEIRYNTADGTRGRENMTRSGRGEPSTGDSQTFTYSFRSILAPLSFDVIGGDDRLRNLHVEVVDSPALTDMVVHCEYPEYMQRAPRDFHVSGMVQLPHGAKATIHATSNKDLVEVPIHVLQGDQKSLLIANAMADGGNRREFDLTLAPLREDEVLQFGLLDTDGIQLREPVRLAVDVIQDEPPRVAVHLHGIGPKITTKALLPIEGEISDDYGLSRAWFEYQIQNSPTVNSPIAEKTQLPDGPVEEKRLSAFARTADKKPLAGLKIDRGSEALDVAELDIKEGQKLRFSVKASDTYALGTGPNVSSSEVYVLDVVSQDELLSNLQARELLLRRRFETIVQDVTDTRDSLVRLDFNGTPKPDAKDPTDKDSGKDSSKDSSEKPNKNLDKKLFAGETQPKGAEPEDAIPGSDVAPDKAAGVDEGSQENTPLQDRQLRVQRAIQNGQRSAQETLEVALGFEDIYEELINNRVNNPELRSRLKDQIAVPLHTISETMFPELERRLQRLNSVLADNQAAPRALADAQRQSDAILVEMKVVLGKMMELETFNELVDVLRAIKDQQAKLHQQTVRKAHSQLEE